MSRVLVTCPTCQNVVILLDNTFCPKLRGNDNGKFSMSIDRGAWLRPHEAPFTVWLMDKVLAAITFPTISPRTAAGRPSV